MNDIATGLTTCVLKDGSQTITANLPMSSFKLTGLAAGSATGDSLRYEQLVPFSGATLITVVSKSGAAVSGAGDTAENVLATITVPANALGANGVLRVTTHWAYTNGANDKTLRVRYSTISGTEYAVYVATTTASARVVTEIFNRAATNSQYGSSAGTLSDGTGLGTSVVTSSVDTTASTTIIITGQKEVGGETLTLNSYTVEIMP